jgi:molybdate transport system substrate-binding protein
MRLILLLALLLAPLTARADQLTVFAAASLTDAMTDIAGLWQAAGHPAPKLSFASSSTLARQIEAGAPANVFASADEKWADYLDQKHLLAPGTRTDLMRNSLVLVEPAGQKASDKEIGKDFDFAKILGADGRLAVGDPAHVPVGIYAEQALKKLGLWDRLQSRLAPTLDVRSGLLLVERGEAPAGIVYATDAKVSKNVVIAARFPADSHDPIVYPFALVASGVTPEAQAFFAFLKEPQAGAVFRKFGFVTE